ncbi:DUF5057 domain-containing protein [Paenibacillus sp. TAF43_2]|uniref:DUF5057 domain-containing protein n=1 Tax=Paenibacillus sp. TAF43_2 TaxID=3233069 RepID=UPI003F9D6B0B
MNLSFLKKRVSIVCIITILAMTFTYIGVQPYLVKAAVPSTTITLSNNSKFVSVKNDSISVSTNQYFFDELFELEDHGDNIVSIKSKSSNKYLSYSTSTNSNSIYRLTLIAKNDPSATEKFVRSILTDGTATFKTIKNTNLDPRYVEVGSATLVVQNPITSDANNNQKFTLPSKKFRPTINVLEITETGVSDLNAIIGGNSLITIKTLKMKHFVASREQLDGNYDAIYIGKGSYNITLPTQSSTSSAHNTASKQNDITQLKATEIIKNFVDKGLPVILYSDDSSKKGLLYQDDLGSGNNKKEALLKKNFSIYNQTGKTKSNVIFVNNNDISSQANFVSKINLLDKGNIRPLLTLTEKPDGYTSTSTKKYSPDEIITFKYAVDNLGDVASKNINLNLYIGTDSSLPFGAEQFVTSQTVTEKSGTLTYKLPPGYSGLQYWRLELSEFGSPLKDIQTGVYRFQDEKINIKVLQVLPNKNTNDSNLNNNLQSKDLITNDYGITIDTTSITNFNNSGYNTLNGKYDMLIFGFVDEYNNFAPIGNNATAAVQQFISTGQSVMFTHDTIFVNNNSESQNWLNKFQTTTGQIAPRTDMGLGNPLQATSTEKVNEGLLTQYPFLLNESTQVATTHNQYFTLDLEDATVIPWYNMIGGVRTSGDSWNHYYTYSKGNVTYSGSGHTNKGFPAWEQKLFINTMYRAFMGSNHAPQLTVFSPIEYNQADNNFIPSYQDLLINYKAEDFDLNDRELTTSINLIYNEKSYPVTTNEKILSGSTVNKTVTNPLPNGGDLKVQIIASDAKGAEVVKFINVRVVKVSSNLELSRTVSSNVVQETVEKDTAATFTYTLTPRPINRNEALAADRMIVTSLKFKETFPANLEIGALPTDFNKIGTLATGYTVTGTIKDIRYTLSGNTYTANPFTFSIPVTPKKDGSYPLLDAQLDFKDIGEQASKKLQFPHYVLKAITKIKTVTVNNKTILVGDRLPLIPVFTPEDPTNKQLIWTSDHPTVASIDSSTGIITGITSGTAHITASTTDGSKITTSAVVTVISPGLNITGPENVAVSESIILESKLFTADYENITSYNWKVTSNTGNISLSNTSGSSTNVQGLSAGDATITLKVTTDQTDPVTNKKREYTATKTISVYKKLISIDLADATLLLNETKQMTPVFNPVDAKNKAVTWSSSDTSIVNVGSDGKITGVGIGAATITVTASDGSGISKNALVTVTIPNPVISGPSNIPLGTSIALSAVIPASGNDPIKTAVWSVTEGNANGILTSQAQDSATLKGIKAGNVEVKLTVTTNAGRIYVSNKLTIEVNQVKLKLLNSKTVDPGAVVELWGELQSIPRDGKDKIKNELLWSSSNNEIVSVNVDGVITALKSGTATITVAYTNDPKVAAQITIIVNNPTTTTTDGKGRY